jgi:hypothetical protein
MADWMHFKDSGGKEEVPQICLERQTSWCGTTLPPR